MRKICLMNNGCKIPALQISYALDISQWKILCTNYLSMMNVLRMAPFLDPINSLKRVT